MATSVTIHGGQGSDTISFAFTVTGTNTTHYATLFANNVNALLVTDPTVPVAAGGTGSVTGGATPVYVLDAPTTGGGASPTYTIATPGYVLDTISGGATINLTGTLGEDTILVAAVNAQATITGAGGDNQITFVTGENEYIGTADTGGDTLVAGSGYDTIYTSASGSTTVNSGTGSLTAYLQDTTVGVGINDYVWLDDGAGTIYANGVDDAVIATVGSQTIYGDSVSVANTVLRVELTNQGGSTSTVGNDTVSALYTDTVAVYDYTSANTINGGTGTLYFIGGDSITATVHGGTGTAYVFGAAGDSITLGALGDTLPNPGTVYFVSGGNETLSGGAEIGTLYAFGADGTSMSGGSGFNVLTPGAGNETLTGGTGTNYFNIDAQASANGNLVLNDFSTDGRSDLVLSNGFTQADVAAIEDSNNTMGGNLQVTLSDGVQLTFVGITSGSELTGHITLQ
jgi:hypothetical protein